ncbi:MAG: hypothetical protein J3Q66DRAFT_143685 [Benniella sp.]|nr:MAG: hypothetical protein J3Q66DRAFT_143685 [Benniella sp.]
MNLSQNTYLETVRDREFSLRAWAMLADVRYPKQLDLIWTQDATTLLQGRSDQRSAGILNQVRKMPQKERLAVFNKVKEDKDHEDKMRPTVNNHLHHLAQKVNDDLANDARSKRQLQYVEERKTKKTRMSKNQSFPTAESSSASFPVPSSATSSFLKDHATPPSPSVQRVERMNDMEKARRPTIELPTRSPLVPFHVDPDGFPTLTYSFGKDNVGVAFRNLQRDGAILANDLAKKVTLENLHCFLAVNFIWDTSSDIGLKSSTVRAISEQLCLPKFVFTKSHLLLMYNLEQELATGCIQQTASSRDELGKDIIDMFTALKKELPKTSYSFGNDDGEDTFVHSVLHSMVSTVFQGFKITWANKTATGSKLRRKDDGKEGLRPNCQVIKNGVRVLYIEVKPLESTTESEYLADRWKLANLAKDELDACYRRHIQLPFMTIVQVYGRKLEVYTVSLRNGIYHMHQQHQGYVPCARDDGASIRPYLSALYSIKNWLAKLDLPQPYVSASNLTAPPQLRHIKPSLLTPSKRKMF